MECTNITKQDAKVVRWLQGGASTDDARPVLEGLLVEEDITVSASGFELRTAPTPESLKEFAGQLIKLGSTPRANGDLVGVEQVEGKFPDYKQIVPKDKPVFEIALNRKLLAGLIKNMGENDRDPAVLFQFYDSHKPIVIRTEDKFAVLMPMHLSEGESMKKFNPIGSPQIEETKESK